MTHRFADLLFAVALLVAAALMLLCALASRSAQTGTIAGFEQAISLTPWSADYRERLALRYTREDRTKEAKAQLTYALEYEPARASAMLQLARIAEAEGNFAEAERWLKHAAHVDHQLAPAWALANFYLRREDQPNFWLWLSRAYAVSSANTAAIWQLAARVEPDVSNVLRRLDVRDRGHLSDYLRYLHEAGDSRNALALLDHVPTLQPADRPPVLWLCDGLLQSNNMASAITLWRRLQIADLAPKPDATNLLVNPGFSTAPSGQCFDWRVPPQIDVAANFDPAGIAHFALAGRQQMDIVLIEQIIPVDAGALYDFSWSARLDAVGARAGLAWEVADSTGNVIAHSPALDSPEWQSASLRFTAPPRSLSCTLRLRYRRPEGFTRIEGDLSLKDLKLRRL